jgi:hypothetical protein
LGEKITFLWEFFSDIYFVNKEVLASSLFSTWGILRFLMLKMGEFIEIFGGILLNKSGNTVS